MIIGAGLAGLITAHAFQGHDIIEASPKPTENHKALLRFRSKAVSDLTGIEFEPVTVRKGIYDQGKFVEPSIAIANAYSMKCLGRIEGDRSIWNLDPVTRYIAPEDFYERLLENVGNRVQWDSSVDFTRLDPAEPIISTAPMNVVCQQFGMARQQQFTRAAITVKRFRVTDCNVYQTVYFPTSSSSMYRASITKDLLIVEFAGEPRGDWMTDLIGALRIVDMVVIEEVKQKYGKIAPIDEGVRRSVVTLLTRDHGIYSIGRFATWRNILLDDVVNDISVVKRLIRSDEHERKLTAMK